MAINFSQSSKFTRTLLIAELLLASYLLYTLTVSVYKSYEIDRHIKDFEEENQRIEEENKQKLDEFEYYTSPAYAEKMAKQNLGLIKPGEQVIIIPDGEDISSGVVGSANMNSANGDDEISNLKKWWKFFFDFGATKS